MPRVRQLSAQNSRISYSKLYFTCCALAVILVPGHQLPVKPSLVHLSMRGHSTSSTRNLLLARPTNIVTLFAALPCPAPESFEHYSPTYSGSSAQGNATLLSRRLLPHAIPYPSWCHIIAVAEPLLAFF